MTVSQEEKQASPKEIVREVYSIVARRRWLILCTSCFVALASLAAIQVLPVRYASDAVLVRHQPVSPGYALGGNAMLSNDEAMDTSTREVLSQSKLLAIINQFGLYAEARKKGATPEELVQMMRRGITIEPIDVPRPQAESSLFKISYSANNPKVAQDVVIRLIQGFIDANVKTREDKAEATTKFLKEQVEASRGRLAQQEQRLQEFKAQYAGTLPEQAFANATAASDLRTQLQSTLHNLDRVKQQRATLDASLTGTLNRKQAERATLLSRYTPRHPEVLKKEQEIAAIDAVLRRLKGGAAGGNGQTPISSDDPALVEAARQAESTGRELETLSRESARLNTTVGQYQGRANAAPLREQQLAALLRDYDLTKQEYASLLNRQLQSQLAGNLEESGEGVQFRLIDPPTLPAVPNSPPRRKIGLGGLAGGFALGLGLAFLLHILDGSLHSEKATKQRFALPIVLGIPVMRTEAEERRRTWVRRFEWVTGCVMTLAVLAAEVYVLRKG